MWSNLRLKAWCVMTGRRPAGNASVCPPDRPAVRTHGGPGPDQRGLCQCLCRAAGHFGATGAWVLLGASQLGAELNRDHMFTPIPKVCWSAWDLPLSGLQQGWREEKSTQSYFLKITLLSLSSIQVIFKPIPYCFTVAASLTGTWTFAALSRLLWEYLL